ncbi:hypothetical protein URH17368_2389 [Alicyclobacillus hesperidum URH17-3-68]|uniref:Flagellar protein FliT n=1 Tax=Alicyclobacillus hesperidum TaxID=89784 RepID=A0AA37TYW3_9BACL|nr:hypothetical protein [Alicyclobacillus hesperidum]EJY54911.1 hypothetical protein URH17368_2389 [Alicyclobacillus hesperidum URH17-3-68]GLV13082.1 hypothetical protein Heshes_07660 [Alicyclobacillus hesperidum]
MADVIDAVAQLEAATDRVLAALKSGRTDGLLELLTDQCVRLQQVESVGVERCSEVMRRIAQKIQIQQMLIEQGLSISEHFLKKLYQGRSYSQLA